MHEIIEIRKKATQQSCMSADFGGFREEDGKPCAHPDTAGPLATTEFSHRWCDTRLKQSFAFGILRRVLLYMFGVLKDRDAQKNGKLVFGEHLFQSRRT